MIVALAASAYDQKSTIYLFGEIMLRILLFIVSLMGIVSSAYGYSLYSVSVMLKDNQVASEKAAKEKAFGEVLVRASGQTDIVKNAAISKIIPQAQAYINQIGFSNENGKKILQVDFNDEKIRSLLSRVGATYWADPRPSVLIWLVEDQSLGKQIIWEQSSSSFINQLKNQAKRRGLPVLIPVGDFDDVVSVAVPDLWEGAIESIANASERYGANGLVIVRLHKNKSMDWQFYPDENAILEQGAQDGRAVGSLDNNIATLVNFIANYYVKNTQVSFSDAINNQQLLQVNGIDTTADFFALEKLLKSFNSVASVSVNGVAGTTAFFKLDLLVSPDAFENELAKTNQLIKSDDEYIHLNTQPLIPGLGEEQSQAPYSFEQQMPQGNQDSDHLMSNIVPPLIGLVYYWAG